MHRKKAAPAPRKATLALATALTLAAPAAGAVGDAQAPDDILLFPLSPASTNDGRGPFWYDPDEVIAAYRAVQGPVLIDYEHQLDDGQVRTGPIPAAGSIVDVYFDPSTGIRAQIEWTPEAAALIASKAYRYFSPAWFFIPEGGDLDAMAGRVIEIYGGSLVNRPAFGSRMQIASDSRTAGDYTKHKPAKTEQDSMKELLKALNLAEDATAEQALAAIAALQGKAAEIATVAAELEAESETAAAVTTAASRKFATNLDAYVEKSAHEAVVAQLAALQEQTTVASIKSAIASTEASGVVLTDEQRDAYVKVGLASRETLDTVLAALKPTIRVGTEKDPTPAANANDPTHGLTVEQQTAAKQRGVSFKAYAAALKHTAAKQAT